MLHLVLFVMCLTHHPRISSFHFIISFLWKKKKKTQKDHCRPPVTQHITHTHAQNASEPPQSDFTNNVCKAFPAGQKQHCPGEIYTIGSPHRLTLFLVLLLSNSPKSARSTLKPHCVFFVHVNHKSPAAPYDTSGSASAHYDSGTLQLHNRYSLKMFQK